MSGTLSSTITGWNICIGPVTIMQNGNIQRNPSFTTNDDAAIEFWLAVERMGLKRISMEKGNE